MRHIEREDDEMSYIVIKIGGSTLTNLDDSIIQDIYRLKQQGYQPIIVHGGGPFINTALAHNDVAPEFKDGLRVTTEQVLSITSQTLIGKVNPELVSKFNVQGQGALGLNGIDAQLFDIEPLHQQYGFVGEPININTVALNVLASEFIPVIASIGLKQGTKQQYNINADTLAYKIAEVLEAPIYILSDIPGVLIDEKVQASLNAKDIQKYIEQKEIYGGMIPKVQDAVLAIQHGCQKVVIAAGSETHIVEKVHKGDTVGTTIH